MVSLTSTTPCVLSFDDKENNVNEMSTNQILRRQPTGRINSAPLRLVDANKLIFAPSPKGKVKIKETVANIVEYEEGSTLSLVNKIKDKMGELHSNLKQKDEMVCRLECEISNSKQVIENLEKSNRKLSADMDHLNSEINQSKQRLEDDKKRVSMSKNSDHIEVIQLKKQLKSLNEEYARYKQSASPKVKINKFEQETEYLRKQLADQRAFFEQHLDIINEKQKSEIATMNSRLQEYRRKAERAAAETNEISHAYSILQQKFTSHNQSKQYHIQLLTDQLRELAVVSNTRSATGEQISKLEREKSALKDALRRTTNELEWIESLKIENFELQKDLKEKNGTIMNLEKALEDIRQPYIKAKGSAEYYSKSMDVVQQRLHKLTQENRYLRTFLPDNNMS